MTADAPAKADQSPDPQAAPGWPLSLSQALLLPRIVIESTTPAIEGGVFAVKSVVGQRWTVDSKVYADGHDKLAVMLRWRDSQGGEWRSAAMRDLGNDS